MYNEMRWLRDVITEKTNSLEGKDRQDFEKDCRDLISDFGGKIKDWIGQDIAPPPDPVRTATIYPEPKVTGERNVGNPEVGEVGFDGGVTYKAKEKPKPKK